MVELTLKCISAKQHESSIQILEFLVTVVQISPHHSRLLTQNRCKPIFLLQSLS